jgi:Tfp pilus assembly PilM family ATPase
VASIIGLDWSSDGIRLVAGRGAGNKLTIEQAIFLPEAFRPEAAAAEAAGRQLQTLLKQAGIKPGPVCAVIGREHLLCRDIRYPDVPAHEVPTIVQFQVSKELTVPPEQAVVDFAPVSLPWPSGEKRALGMVVRKDIVRAYDRLCEAAGLTLQGLTPRAFAVQANWAALPRTGSAAEVFGLIAGGELTVVRQGEVLFSRQLDDTVPLAAELRRSLAAYASQFSKQPVQELFLADAGTPDGIEELRSAFRLPVHLYNPWSSVRSGLGPQQDVRFVGACGILQLASSSKQLPLDLKNPKKGEPPQSTSRKYARMGILAAVFLVVLLGGAYFWITSSLEGEIDSLQESISAKNAKIKEMGDIDQQVAAIQEWADKEVVILDEIYDLIAVFPDTPGIRITRAHWLPFTDAPAATRPAAGAATGTAPTSPGARNLKPIGQLTLEIVAEKPETLNELQEAIGKVNHWHRDLWRRDPQDPKRVTAQLRIYPMKPSDYNRTLSEPIHKTTTTGPTSTGPRRPRGGRP